MSTDLERMARELAEKLRPEAGAIVECYPAQQYILDALRSAFDLGAVAMRDAALDACDRASLLDVPRAYAKARIRALEPRALREP